MSEVKFCLLRLEGQFTAHITESVRMIQTLPWHDEDIINTILSHKHFTKKEHTTLATYCNYVQHTTNSAVFLKQSLLLASCPNVLVHV
jgi:cellulose synthase/poly-beta-1,6-N-acetylglucosamine synthase-like glycosyltransferase